MCEVTPNSVATTSTAKTFSHQIPQQYQKMNRTTLADRLREKITAIWQAFVLQFLLTTEYIIRKISSRHADRIDAYIKRLSQQTLPNFTEKALPVRPEFLQGGRETHCVRPKARWQRKMRKRDTMEFVQPPALKEVCDTPHFSLADLDRIPSEKMKAIAKNIHSLARARQPDSEQEIAELMTFCLNVVQDKSERTSLKGTPYEKQQSPALTALGKILFLIDRQPTSVWQAIKNPNQDAVLRALDQTFKEILQKSYSGLVELFAQHQKTKLQTTEVAINTQIPLEIARLLWTSSGELNVGIIDPVKRFFLESKPLHHNFEINLNLNLKALQTNAALQQKLTEIRKPASPESPAHQLICAMLGLPLTTMLTDVDAKQVAVAALLGHPRQEQETNCFALSLAISLLVSNPERCVDDFTAILRSSKLQRRIEGQQLDLPFLLKFDDSSLDIPITLAADGRLHVEKQAAGFIWDAPGIQAACRVLQITDARRLLLKVLRQQPIPGTPRELLERILAERHPENRTHMLQQANLAYLAQTHNLLLQAWTNAIAGMAEAHAHSYIKEAVVESVLHAFKITCQDIVWSSPESKKTFFTRIEDALRPHLHLYYDPSVANRQRLLKNHQSRGAFVLYDKRDRQSSQEWKRIGSQKEFHDWMQRILTESLSAFPEEDSAAAARCVSQLRTDVFIYAVLKKYQMFFPTGETLSKGYANLKLTPWISQLGHDATQVLQVYIESQHLPPMEQTTPKNAQQLLESLLLAGRRLPRETLSSFEGNPYQLFFLRILNVHTCSLMVNPQLLSAWKSPHPISQWIQEKVIFLGKQVANAYIENVTRKRLIDFATGTLVQPQKIKQFHEQVSRIPDSLRIHEYRAALLKAINTVGYRPEKTAEEVAIELDTFLCQVLPTHLQHQLRNSILPFADTNWHSGVHDVHFCFAVNPGTGQLELMEVLDDNSQLRAIDQGLVRKQWEYSFEHI